MIGSNGTKRALIPGLRNPHPMLRLLPAVYQEQDHPMPVNGAARTFPTGVFTTTISASDVEGASRASRSKDVGRAGDWTIIVERPDHHERDGELARRADLFEAIFYRNGERFGTADISATHARVTVHATGGHWRADGVYAWTFTGSSLLLEPLDDPSDSRRLLLSAHVLTRKSFTERFLSAFDDVLAPIVSAIDNIEAYIDPYLTPEDFLEWLESWFDITSAATWSAAERRRRIANAVQLFNTWGTLGGIEAQVAAVSGIEPERIEVTDSGGVVVSTTPGGPFPGEPVPRVSVRLKVPDPSAIDAERLDAAVARAKPAHVLHDVEVVAK